MTRRALLQLIPPILPQLKQSQPPCTLPPGVCVWNDTVIPAMKEYSNAEKVFADAAKEWAVAKDEEMRARGSVSVGAIKKFTAMWVAWQGVRAAWKKAEKAMHDFSVVEMNQQ